MNVANYFVWKPMKVYNLYGNLWKHNFLVCVSSMHTLRIFEYSFLLKLFVSLAFRICCFSPRNNKCVLV